MTGFSGWGPTDDGRIKPDLVANGSTLFSSIASADAAYDIYTGTSMATPTASGSVALLRQHAANLGQSWRAATYKALILHTADEAGAHPGPDSAFGWGLMNTRSAVELMTEHRLSGGLIHQAVLQASGVNDLDMWSTRPENDLPLLPWVLDPAQPANAATKGDNDRDNVEQIYLEAPVAGSTS